MSRILFATNRDNPELTADDRLAAAALGALGVHVAPVIWNEAEPESLEDVDAVVVRSCWDYHLHARAFGGWIDALEQAGVPVVNRPPLLRWNLHKRYLRELEERGVEIVPTAWVEEGDAPALAELLATAGWREAVVKPAVSLSAYQTWRTSPGEAAEHEERFAALRTAGDVLVQRYVPEVTTAGEWSLVFFGGEYSHAVRKRPRQGDFRVQMDHGGHAVPEAPPPALIADAERAIASLPELPAYARVDGIEVRGRLVLMEMECIDPVLYLGTHPPAAERFARRLVAEVRVAPRPSR